jgi:hypothetical protein
VAGTEYWESSVVDRTVTTCWAGRFVNGFAALTKSADSKAVLELSWVHAKLAATHFPGHQLAARSARKNAAPMDSASFALARAENRPSISPCGRCSLGLLVGLRYSGPHRPPVTLHLLGSIVAVLLGATSVGAPPVSLNLLSGPDP